MGPPLLVYEHYNRSTEASKEEKAQAAQGKGQQAHREQAETALVGTCLRVRSRVRSRQWRKAALIVPEPAGTKAEISTLIALVNRGDQTGSADHTQEDNACEECKDPPALSLHARPPGFI